MSCRVLILLALLLGLSSAQRTPTISYISPPVITKTGGTIEMDCSVLYATEYPVLWVKFLAEQKILLTNLPKMTLKVRKFT